MLAAWRARARALKTRLQALAIAYHDPRTPLRARLVMALVLAYALSPIDLVPDFIPVLGYLDDLILLPIGIALAIRLVPDVVWHDARVRAAAAPWSGRPSRRAGAAVIVILWILAFIACWWLVRRW